MGVLDNLAINHYCMHISTPDLKHDVSIGVEQWEHHWRLIILNQNKICLFTWGYATDKAIHPQCLSTTKSCPHHNILGTQMTKHDGFITFVRFHMLT